MWYLIISSLKVSNKYVFFFIPILNNDNYNSICHMTNIFIVIKVYILNRTYTKLIEYDGYWLICVSTIVKLMCYKYIFLMLHNIISDSDIKILGDIISPMSKAYTDYANLYTYIWKITMIQLLYL